MENVPSITIQKVAEFSPELHEAVRRLAEQEGKNYKELTEHDFKEMIATSALTLFIARDIGSQEIVGMATLIVCRIPYVKKAAMEDLVVDEAYRGRGIGTTLIERVLTEAKNKGAAYLDFTSRPRREGENRLYEKLGFKTRETNVYRQIFSYNEV